jgi:sulfatase modifying factor 1
MISCKFKPGFFQFLLLLSVLVIVGVRSAPGQATFGITTTNNLSILSWTTAPGIIGVLQSSPSLTAPNWVNATDAVPFNYGAGLAVTVTNSVQARYFRLWLVPPTAEGMEYIPAGSFTIGDTLDGLANARPTNVYVSAFFMDRTLVTSNLWSTVYDFALALGYTFTNSGQAKAATHPIENVDWFDCVKWCNARSQWMGRTPVYYTDAALTQVFTNGEPGTNVWANWSANGFRLPTEAEWEKAARGGLTGQRFPWGDTISWSQANYWGNSLAVDSTNGLAYDLSTAYGIDPAFATGNSPFTSPVATFAPNGYGLYDMAGNVEELCWDWYYGPPYPKGSPYLGGVDPRGGAPALGPLNYRIARGGDYIGTANGARCAYRDAYYQTDTWDHLGFRCVRSPVFFAD